MIHSASSEDLFCFALFCNVWKTIITTGRDCGWPIRIIKSSEFSDLPGQVLVCSLVILRRRTDNICENKDHLFVKRTWWISKSLGIEWKWFLTCKLWSTWPYAYQKPFKPNCYCWNFNFVDPRPSTNQSTSLKSGSLFLLMVSVRPYIRTYKTKPTDQRVKPLFKLVPWWGLGVDHCTTQVLFYLFLNRA